MKGMVKMSEPSGGVVRKFTTGATRNAEVANDPEAFISPLVLARYNEYMAKHRVQADGSLRDGDNWQKGIPLASYMKSGWRHFFDWWLEHRGLASREGLEEGICALLFNAMGYLHETLKAKGYKQKETSATSGEEEDTPPRPCGPPTPTMSEVQGVVAQPPVVSPLSQSKRG
jgi:hypothetical protein